MSTIDAFVSSYAFNRKRTLGLLDSVEKLPAAQAALAWRPAPGRAPLGWQLMHIGITEELFASERLVKKPGMWTELWPRFKGGSTPDDDAPSAATIRQVLAETRARLLESLATYSDARLSEIPPAFAERGWTLHDVLCVISWHEAHHQGQAHITFNLYKQHAGV